MSEDDRWSDVIHQVLDALHEANVDDPNTQKALAEGVRQALESMDSGMDLNIEIMGTEGFDSNMEVEVVDGGRTADSPPTEGKKPSLRIADPSENMEASGPTEVESPPYVTQVKVLKGNPFFDGSMGGPLATDHGWITIPNNGEPDAAWQTIYQGLRPRLYRIACLDSGRIDVTVDGVQVERLNPGQSIDVEGLAIRVTSPDKQGATGNYLPVLSVWGEE